MSGDTGCRTNLIHLRLFNFTSALSRLQLDALDAAFDLRAENIRVIVM